MDAQDIFRKLSVGCSFKRKRPEFIPGSVKSDPDKPALHVNDPNQLEKQIKSEEEVKEEVESENEEKPEIQDAEEIQPAKKKKKKEFSEEKKKLLEEEQINHLRKLHRITVKGKNVVKPIESFAELSSDYKVSDKLVTNIEKAGYSTPTPIQMQTIPAMLQDSGCEVPEYMLKLKKTHKTVKKKLEKTEMPRAQVDTTPVYEKYQTDKLKRKMKRKLKKTLNGQQKDGTDKPKRKDRKFIKKDQNATKTQKDLEQISLIKDFSSLRGRVGITLGLHSGGPGFDFRRGIFCATHTEDVAKWCRRELKRRVQINVGLSMSPNDRICTPESASGAFLTMAVDFNHTNPALKRRVKSNLARMYRETEGAGSPVQAQDETILLEFVQCEQDVSRLQFLPGANIVFIAKEEFVQCEQDFDSVLKGIEPPVLVFVQSKERAQELYNELIYDGINVDVIHSDRTQKQRDNVVRSFRTGRIWILITTELLGRGIDFRTVRLVVNYDFPSSAISYIHRIGRAGRGGREGKAVTFFTKQDAPLLRR
ncbi:probable ATP-dependent RNA helicase DDX52 [Diaphorina citri]|uniref:RNA helicase n=1 Tax=Diaphorina citri TaxID=121845 RepID=A0A3Q0J5S5_DIACI|nr:probable ATP-dependent RNA helicase DDX52 [Diaphorina citri]